MNKFAQKIPLLSGEKSNNLHPKIWHTVSLSKANATVSLQGQFSKSSAV
jgi:hypothetical protein